MVMKRLLTIREFCDIYGVKRTRAYALIDEGAVEAVKIGSSTRIIAESAEIWAAKLPRVRPKKTSRETPDGSP